MELELLKVEDGVCDGEVRRRDTPWRHEPADSLVTFRIDPGACWEKTKGESQII